MYGNLTIKYIYSLPKAVLYNQTVIVNKLTIAHTRTSVQ